MLSGSDASPPAHASLDNLIKRPNPKILSLSFLGRMAHLSSLLYPLKMVKGREIVWILNVSLLCRLGPSVVELPSRNQTGFPLETQTGVRAALRQCSKKWPSFPAVLQSQSLLKMRSIVLCCRSPCGDFGQIIRWIVMFWPLIDPPSLTFLPDSTAALPGCIQGVSWSLFTRHVAHTDSAAMSRSSVGPQGFWHLSTSGRWA